MVLRHMVVVVGLVVGLGACFGSAPETGVAPNEPRVVSGQEVDLQLGRRVRVVGEAQNTGSGAMVIDGDLVVQMDAFPKWPAPIVGKTVEVVGRLERNDPRVVAAAPTQAEVVLRQASYLLRD